MVFDRATRVRLPFNSSHQDVQREFDRLLAPGALQRRHRYYARHAGRRRLHPARRPADARRAIVILTDDQTEFDRDDEAVSRAWRAPMR